MSSNNSQASQVKDDEVKKESTQLLSSTTQDSETKIPSPSSSSKFSEVTNIMEMNRPPKILHPTLAFHEQRWKSMEESSRTPLLPGYQCPSFHNVAVMEDGVTMKSFSNTNFAKSYVVLFFFPMDRSVDYSELMAFKEHLEQFAKHECQVVGVTSDSLISILNWLKLGPEQGGTGGAVKFPIISDKTMDLAEKFGVNQLSGMLTRATFILDKRRIVRHSSVGRSVEEVLRIVQAIKEVDLQACEEHEVCTPTGWTEGDDVIVNTPEGKKEYYSKIVAMEK